MRCPCAFRLGQLVRKSSKQRDFVAGARNQTRVRNRGRRSVLWTLPNRWAGVSHLKFEGLHSPAAGAGNSYHGCCVFRGSIPEKGCIFGT